MVVLFDNKDYCVIEAVAFTLEVGDLLERNRLHPTEVGILFTVVYNRQHLLMRFQRYIGRMSIMYHTMATTSFERNLTICYNAVEATRVFEFAKLQ